MIIYLRKNSAIGGVFVNTEYSIILCSNISDFDFAEAVFAFYPDIRAIDISLGYSTSPKFESISRSIFQPSGTSMQI